LKLASADQGMSPGAPALTTDAGILLVDPKYDYNVGAVVRACAVFGAGVCLWTGTRVLPGGPAGLPKKYRLPREERLKGYAQVFKDQVTDSAAELYCEESGLTPVAVEVRENAEPLDVFIHPERALYVFGPEDGTLGRHWLRLCHRFIRIPSAIRSPLNLAAAANVVLYDRFAKLRREGGG